jgi:hypothetical protein
MRTRYNRPGAGIYRMARFLEGLGSAQKKKMSHPRANYSTLIKHQSFWWCGLCVKGTSSSSTKSVEGGELRRNSPANTW